MVDELYKLSLALQTMKEQRNVLIKDCCENHCYELLHGLRTYETPAVYQLYLDKYSIIWLDSHWNTVCSNIALNATYADDKREIVDYFAKEFSVLLKPYGYNESQHTAIFFEFLQIQLQTINDMIAISDKHELNLQKLLNTKEKHSIQFNEMIAALK